MMQKLIEQLQSKKKLITDNSPASRARKGAYVDAIVMAQQLLDDLVVPTPSPGGNNEFLQMQFPGRQGSDIHQYNDEQELAEFLKGSSKEDLFADNENLLSWVVIFHGAISELLQLKNIKETQGKTPDYIDRQPRAWYAAKQAIELWRKSNYGARPLKQSGIKVATVYENAKWVKATELKTQDEKDILIAVGNKIKIYGQETTVKGFYLDYNDGFEDIEGKGRWEVIILTEGRGDPFERSLENIEVTADQDYIAPHQQDIISLVEPGKTKPFITANVKQIIGMWEVDGPVSISFGKMVELFNEVVFQWLKDREPAGTDQLTISDYQEFVKDQKRLVRELDVLLNGEEGAAEQASLCDIVSQVQDMKEQSAKTYSAEDIKKMSQDQRDELVKEIIKPMGDTLVALYLFLELQQGIEQLWTEGTTKQEFLFSFRNMKHLNSPIWASKYPKLNMVKMANITGYLQHRPDCLIMQDWSEAEQAMMDTPENLKDESYHQAYQEMKTKQQTCSCGLDEVKKLLNEIK